MSRGIGASFLAALAICAEAAGTRVVPPPVACVQDRADLVTTANEPVHATRGDDGRLFLDFGRASFGWLLLEFDTPMPETELRVHLGEKRAGSDAVETKPGASIAYECITVAVKPRARTAEAIPSWSPRHAHWISNPAGEKEVIPFRYAEIHGLPPTLTPPRVVRMSRHVPFDDAASSFSCSDPALVEVWNLCKHSIKVTNFLGVYVDGNRERVPYEADAYINQLCHYAVDAHYKTGRVTYEHLLHHPTWPIEWRQHVPLMAAADWLYSGDDAGLRRNYETIRASLMLDRRRPDGLFVGRLKGVPRDIVDWPECERDGYDMTQDVKTVTNAFHARSLEAMATIARVVGRTAEAEMFAAMRDATARAMRDKLFDVSRGRYVDGLDQASGRPSGHASIHANMLPLAFGLVPEADRGLVADFVSGRGMACSVYGAQYLLDGLFDAGYERQAIALLTGTGSRGWLHMSRDLGSTVTLEAWDTAFKPNLDWNHAWGAVPANVIPRKLMGVEPLKPGFDRISVKPRIGDLSWATLRHPSPKGPVDVSVKSSDRTWEVAIDLPDGVVAEVHVPVDDTRRIKLIRGGKAENLLFLRPQSGRSVVQVSGRDGRLAIVKADKESAGRSPRPTALTRAEP